MCSIAVMLRLAAAVALLFAVIPTVTPMRVGSSIRGECRNLTSISPGTWPAALEEQPPFVVFLVMPSGTCVGAALTSKYVLGYTLCRHQLEFVNFRNDVNTDNSVARLGSIQGLVPRELYQERQIKRFIHYAKSLTEMRKDPIMIAELKKPFDTNDKFYAPPIYSKTVFSHSKTDILEADVSAFEHSINMPVYHQTTMDVKVGTYARHCKKFGRTRYYVGEKGLCTWNVSPVRTVCRSDLGAPLLHKGNLLGITVGIIDDSVRPSNHCGEGRIHYNMFLRVEDYAPWIYEKTGKVTKLVTMEGEIELPQGESPSTIAPLGVRRFQVTTPRLRKRIRSGVGRPAPPQALSLLVGIAFIAREMCFC